MELLSKKLVKGFGNKHVHWCPGCEKFHPFSVDSPQESNGAQWSWDGNSMFPTFNPSMLITIPEWTDPDDGETSPATCCHYFLHAGKLKFLGDCTHSLVGQTVDLPDIPTERW